MGTVESRAESGAPRRAATAAVLILSSAAQAPVSSETFRLVGEGNYLGAWALAYIQLFTFMTVVNRTAREILSK